MKSLKFARIAAVALAAAASSAAFAAAGDTQSLTVNATVSGACKMSTISPMAFTLDPTVGTDQTASTTVQYKCTKGVTPGTFTVGGVAANYSGSLANGGNTMPYSIAWTAPSTAGSGLGSGVTPISVTLTGTILGTDYVNAAAGTYTQTISVTVAP
jgi:spore coat protein U-like protein